MQVDLSISKQLYSEAKFWIPAITAAWTVFKFINSFSEVKTNHLPHLQASMDDLNKKMDSQTQTICDATKDNTEEIKELRGDIRQLTTALLTKG